MINRIKKNLMIKILALVVGSTGFIYLNSFNFVNSSYAVPNEPINVDDTVRRWRNICERIDYYYKNNGMVVNQQNFINSICTDIDIIISIFDNEFKRVDGIVGDQSDYNSYNEYLDARCDALQSQAVYCYDRLMVEACGTINRSPNVALPTAIANKINILRQLLVSNGSDHVYSTNYKQQHTPFLSDFC